MDPFLVKDDALHKLCIMERTPYFFLNLDVFFINSKISSLFFKNAKNCLNCDV